VRNPLVIAWPDRIKDLGGIRTQFHHVIDIAPTIYEAAGIPVPRRVNGVDQRPLDGVSMLYTFDDPQAKDRHTTQYFEIMGVRGIYHDGWLAATYHNKIQWAPAKMPPFDQDRWELYDLNNDYSQAVDVAHQHPAKLAALKKLFIEEARKNNVFPLDDRGPSRVVNARPSILGDRTTITFGPGPTRMPEDIIRSSFNRSYALTADIEGAGSRPVEGVVFAAGGYFAGLSLYVQNGHLEFTYNYFGSKYTTIEAKERLPAGKVNVRYEFDYDGGGLGKGGTARLLINGRLVAEGRLDATVPLGFTADETFDVGMDTGTPATDTYEGTFPFTGKIDKVTLTLQPKTEKPAAVSEANRSKEK
jgi:hypothetical protein